MNVYMIMCHKNSKQVLRLAYRCISNKSDVIIHPDINMSNQDYEELAQACKNIDGLYLTDKRLHGELDTRSLVDIAMEMIKKAKQVEDNQNKEYKYYSLLSGQDYILKHIDEINLQLGLSYPKPFIDCTPYSANNWLYHKFKANNAVYSFKKWINKKFKKRGTIVRRIFNLLNLIFSRVVERLSFNDYNKLRKNNVDLYGGSAWWILPDLAINYIFDEYKNNTMVVDLLLKTLTPEESFFQIMTKRSPVSELVQVNPPDMVAQNCKTWAYFSDEGKPFKGHPYIFTVDEYEKLINNHFWFARKFDTTVDEEILNMLDKNIR